MPEKPAPIEDDKKRAEPDPASAEPDSDNISIRLTIARATRQLA